MSYPLEKQNKELVKEFNLGNLQKFQDKLSEVLLINEVFDTIQCEGKSMGKSVVFVRTYGCNLRCGFANPTGKKGCDTLYTWKPSETEESDKNRYTPEMLVREIMQYHSHDHWVITGGEPLLQQKKLIKVFEEYKKQTGKYPFVEIETNGTIIPSNDIDYYINQYNVSVKLSNSNATEKTGYTKDEYEYDWNNKNRRIKDEAINYFNKNDKAYFKFVVNKIEENKENEALEEIRDLEREYNIPKSKIWLMPEGNSAEDINTNSLGLVELCKSEGYTFTTRLHILLYGFLRGV